MIRIADDLPPGLFGKQCLRGRRQGISGAMLLHELVPIGLGARADGFRLEEAPFLQGELEPGEPVEKVEGQIAKVLIDFVSAQRYRAPDGWAGVPSAAVDTELRAGGRPAESRVGKEGGQT